MLVNTEEMKEFAEFWAKVQKSYNYNSSFKMEDVLSEISRLDYWQKNRVITGHFFRDPTITPSSQASGAVSPVWRVYMTDGLIIKDNIRHSWIQAKWIEINLTAIYPNVTPPILLVGQSVAAVIIAASYIDNGHKAIFMPIVFGTPATTGQEQPPSDIEIENFLSSDSDLPGFFRIAKLTLNRTGDTTVTQSQDNTWRDV